MGMSPKHGQTVSFVVVPHSNYAVVASLSWGQNCCVAIESQCRYLQSKHGMDEDDARNPIPVMTRKMMSLYWIQKTGNRLNHLSVIFSMVPPSAVPSYTLAGIQLRRKHGTSKLIYLISVANEEPLLVRGNLHRDNNCVAWVHHRITRFGPQGL